MDVCVVDRLERVQRSLAAIAALVDQSPDLDGLSGQGISALLGYLLVDVEAAQRAASNERI